MAHSGRTAARRICQIGVRGKGVILQRFKDGNLADVRVFKKADGLTWIDSAGRTFTLSWAELRDWIGVRAQPGRLAPKGFPRSNSFGPAFCLPRARSGIDVRADGQQVRATAVDDPTRTSQRKRHRC